MSFSCPEALNVLRVLSSFHLIPQASPDPHSPRPVCSHDTCTALQDQAQPPPKEATRLLSPGGPSDAPSRKAFSFSQLSAGSTGGHLIVNITCGFNSESLVYCYSRLLANRQYFIYNYNPCLVAANPRSQAWMASEELLKEVRQGKKKEEVTQGERRRSGETRGRREGEIRSKRMGKRDNPGESPSGGRLRKDAAQREG